MARRIFTIIALFLMFSQLGSAQQDAMFTKYMFNSLGYNPAYAGSREYMSMGLLHRTQWWGIDGAPHSQNFWIHSPIKYNKIALGMHVASDIIGPSTSISANIDYAYRISIGEAKLSIGLQGGVTNWRSNWSKLTHQEAMDEAYMEENPNMWLPNFGVGLYFYNQEKYFVGVSVPHLIEPDLRRDEDGGTPMTTVIWAKQFRHYYFTAGGAIPLDKSRNYVFRPMALVKAVGLFSGLKGENSGFNNIGAPVEADVDLSVLFYHTLWVGASFRTSIEKFTGNKSSFDSADVWVAYYLKNGIRVGAAYDYTLTKLQSPAQGSFEVMLGYDFFIKGKQIVTPRYF